VKAITYTRTAIKALKKMPGKDSKAIMAKLENYAAGGVEDVTELKGSDLLRLRHGEWRAIFEEDGTVIAVVKVAHRRDVYR
jgi:mRNA interferase RelE/StbE